MNKEWETKTLGDVCHVYQPETISQKQMIAGEHRVYGANGQIGWHNQFNHEAPQLILGCRGSCGTVHVTEPHSWINGNAMVVQPKDGVIDVSFLSYALKGGIELTDAITGAAQPQITRTSLMPLVITFPKLLAEQQRIVGLLDEAFEGLATAKANAEKNLQNARALFESHLQSVFTQRGAGWAEKRLGDVCKFENGDRGKNYPNRNEYVESGIPWINTGHIQPDGTLSTDEMNFITREKYDSLRSGKIQSGDLVYCLRGATLGKTALVAPLTEGAVASSLVILRPSSLLEGRFLYFFLTSTLGQGLIKGFENGAAQPNLGAKSVAKYPVSLPQISEQRKIADSLIELREQTQRLARLYERKLAALEALKKSLLHQAFTGQL
ncbi:MAG: restriction endonuclease subunit S [bacterium]|nr:restriction endonuclease subunit S [bacterium]